MMFGNADVNLPPATPLGQLPDQPVSLPDVPQLQGGGMFGGSRGRNAIMMALAGFMARRNPQLSASMMQMMQNKQELALRDQEYNQHRQDQMTDWRTQEDYRLAHQAPDEFTQMLIAAGIDPNSPQGKAAYNARVTSQTDPVVMTPQGPMLRSQLLGQPPTGAPPVGAVIDDPRKQGGQTGAPSGGFPR